MKAVAQYVILFLVFLPALAGANTIMNFDILPSNYTPMDADRIIGYEFTPKEDIVVTAFGYYDGGQDGLLANHQVAIYKLSDQSLVAQSTVNAATATLDNYFRYTPLAASLTLTKDVTYVLAADSFRYGDPFIWYPGDSGAGPYYGIPSILVDPLISLGTLAHYVFNTSSMQFPYPTSTPPYAYIGANIQFASASAVPEPSTFVLFSLAIGALGICRIKVKSKA